MGMAVQNEYDSFEDNQTYDSEQETLTNDSDEDGMDYLDEENVLDDEAVVMLILPLYIDIHSEDQYRKKITSRFDFFIMFIIPIIRFAIDNPLFLAMLLGLPVCFFLFALIRKS